MEGARTTVRVVRALAKPPHARNPADVQHIAAATEAHGLFTRGGAGLHRDLCCVARGVALAVGEAVAARALGGGAALVVVLQGRLRLQTDRPEAFDAPPAERAASGDGEAAAAAATTGAEHASEGLQLPHGSTLPGSPPKGAGGACGKCAVAGASEAELRALFDSIDADGSGAIDAGELRGALARMGLQKSEAEVRELIAGVTGGRNGRGAGAAAAAEQGSGRGVESGAAGAGSGDGSDERCKSPIREEVEEVEEEGQLDFEAFCRILSDALSGGGRGATWEVAAPPGGSGSPAVGECWVREVPAGGCFGEAALLGASQPLEGAVSALEDSKLLVLPRAEYERVMAEGFDGQLTAKAEALAGAPILAGCLQVGFGLGLGGAARGRALTGSAHAERQAPQGASTGASAHALHTGECAGQNRTE
jgi:hypothetical protein